MTEIAESSAAIRRLLDAAHFAAERHQSQRRKGDSELPYINHPIAVANVLAEAGGVADVVTLVAALLHDTVEDTPTTFDELEGRFGSDVRELVAEVTDDKSLPKAERKRLQVEHAPALSPRAKVVKLGDRICNIRDLIQDPPADWTLERMRDYLDWSERVASGCRGVNAALERRFDETLAWARAELRVR